MSLHNRMYFCLYSLRPHSSYFQLWILTFKDIFAAIEVYWTTITFIFIFLCIKSRLTDLIGTSQSCRKLAMLKQADFIKKKHFCCCVLKKTLFFLLLCSSNLLKGCTCRMCRWLHDAAELSKSSEIDSKLMKSLGNDNSLHDPYCALGRRLWSYYAFGILCKHSKDLTCGP